MGTIAATSGSILLDGVDVTRLAPHERNRMGMAYVPQGRGIFPHLSVLDNLRMGVAAHEEDEEQAIRRIIEEFPRLERLLERDGGELSGGEQQLLAIARALASEPQLVLLDEPTEGIQPSIVDEIADVLEKLNRKRGISLVVVEQSLEFITGLASRIALLQKGLVSREMTGVKAGDPALVNEFVGFGAARAATPAVASAAPAALLPRPLATEPPNLEPDRRRAPAPSPARAPSTNHEGPRTMSARRPTHAQLKSIVTGFGMNMSDNRIGEFLSVMDGMINAYDTVDAMPDYLPPVDYPRTAGYRPTAEENPYNAWYVKTEVLRGESVSSALHLSEGSWQQPRSAAPRSTD
jgi:amidase